MELYQSLHEAPIPYLTTQLRAETQIYAMAAHACSGLPITLLHLGVRRRMEV